MSAQLERDGDPLGLCTDRLHSVARRGGNPACVLAAKCEIERRSLSELALDPDPAVVRIDDRFRDRETEAQAATIAAVGLPELSKDVLQSFGWNSWSRIRDGDAHRAVRRAGVDADAAAFRRELRGI